MSVYIGIDGSQAQRDVCCLNDAGAPIARVVVAPSRQGFAKFAARRKGR